MHLPTLLIALAAISPIAYGNPLKVISKETNSDPFESPESTIPHEIEHVEGSSGAGVVIGKASQSPMEDGSVSTSWTSPNQALSPPTYSDTAKILFWNDANFQGEKKRYQVLDDKCYELPKNLVNYVLSAKLEPKVWYCKFLPKKACEADEGSDEVHQLPAGEYDFLFPEGLDFVSFKCKLYEKRPDPSSSALGLDTILDSLHHHRPASNPTTSYTETTRNRMLPPFTVQLFIQPGYQGLSVVKNFLPEGVKCHSLTNLLETSFRSVAFGDLIQSCSFFTNPDCGGPVALQMDHSLPSVPRPAAPLKSMKCELKYELSMGNDAKPKSIVGPVVGFQVPSVQLFLRPRFSGPYSVIPYYPGTWGCVPLRQPQEFVFHSIIMSSEFKSCKFYPDMACHGKVLLEIRETTSFVQGTEELPIKTILCSFES